MEHETKKATFIQKSTASPVAFAISRTASVQALCRLLWVVVCSLQAAALLISSSGCRSTVQELMQKGVLVRTTVVQETVPAKDTSPVAEMAVGGAPSGNVKVALVDIDGLIVNANQTGFNSVGTNPVDDFRAKLDYIRRHPEIRAVVIRINSPGGGVTASDIMWRELSELKAERNLPVVACFMDVGAGGAYYVATAADHIMAHPTTVTGGIGVILNLYNMEDMLAQLNIIGVPIKAGKNSDLGSPLRAMTEDSRDILQKMAKSFHQRFRDTIKATRGVDLDDKSVAYDGRIFTAQEALELKLIDSIGYLDDSIRLASSMSGCPSSSTVLLHRCRDRADTPYAITPNHPTQLLPLDIPGLSRSEMPTFLYMWQPNPSFEP